MRALAPTLAGAALLLLAGCFVRPWAIEESERIDRMMDYVVDDAEDEAFDGIPAPRGISPMAVVEPGRRPRRGGDAPQAKRKKGGASRGSKTAVPFSSLTPSSGKASKKR